MTLNFGADHSEVEISRDIKQPSLRTLPSAPCPPLKELQEKPCGVFWA